MTLAGTRPPTVDEWEQYELHHRSRMSTKPGITGMWQVSGRSDITDFEEVVRLDRELRKRTSNTVKKKTILWIFLIGDIVHISFFTYQKEKNRLKGIISENGKENFL